MNKNKLNFIIYVLFTLITSYTSTYADDYTGKIIPIVKYHPENFNFIIEKSFVITPYSNYVEIGEDKAFLHLYGKKSTFGSRDAFFKQYIPKQKILEKDSVFIFYLKTHFQATSYNGYYPPQYYGEKKDGKTYFYRGYDEEKYSLSELICLEYGSIENFGETIAEELFNFTLFNDDRNGIDRNLTDESATDFLRNDFRFYSDHPSFDKNKAIDMFITFLKKDVTVSNNEEKLLYEYLLNQSYKKEIKNYHYFYFELTYNIFLKKDLEQVLNRVFHIDKVHYIMSLLKQSAYQRYLCFRKIHRKLHKGAIFFDSSEFFNQVYYHVYPESKKDN